MQREQHLEMHSDERVWLPCTAVRSSLWLSTGSVVEEDRDGATLCECQAKVSLSILQAPGSSLVFHQENEMPVYLGRTPLREEKTKGWIITRRFRLRSY